MLDHHPVLRILLALGTLALAAMMPHDGRPLLWTAVAISPLAVAMLGSGIASETVGPWRRRGERIEALGGALFVGVYGFGVARCLIDPLTGWPLFVGLGALGLTHPASIARQAWMQRHGLQERPLEESARDPAPSPWDRARVAGGMPIFAIVTGTIFVVASIAMGLSGRDPYKSLTGFVFFGAVATMGVSQVLTNQALLTGEGGPWRHRLLWLAVAMFGAGMMLFAWDWPELSRPIRVLLGAVGAVALIAPALGLLGVRGGRAVPTVEGLLVISRRDAVLWPWEVVSSVSVGLWHDNESLFVQLTPGARPVVMRGGPDATERHLRAVDQSRQWTGCELVLMHTMLDAAPLEVLRALERPHELPSVDDVLSR